MRDSLTPKENLRPSPLARWLRRVAFAGAALVALVALFYTVENWRGRKAWAQCQQELKAQGEQLDWAAYVPPRVPDDQNFIKMPLLEAIGYGGRVDPLVWSPIHQAAGRLVWSAWGDWQSGRTMNWPEYQAALRFRKDVSLSPLPQEPAADLLEVWQDIEPQLDELRDASSRPFAQFDLDRSAPFEESSGFNFVAVRSLSQILAFRACAELELKHPDKAFRDVRVIHRLSDALENDNTLVATMIRVALQGLALQPFWEGWAKGRWNDRELADFQAMFTKVDLMPELLRVMRAERAGVTGLVEKYGIQRNELWRVAERSEPTPKDRIDAWRRQARRLAWSLAPRGWTCQNLAALNRLTQTFILPSLRAQPPTVSPAQLDQLKQRMQGERSSGPYRWLVGYAMPNFSKALEVTTRTQTQVNLARIVCALERYRKARGQYPESLSDLSPQFIDKPPIDVILGGPLKYRRSSDGQFVLYSVGWNEKDDGGIPGMTQAYPSSPDFEQGDWVWPHPVEQ